MRIRDAVKGGRQNMDVRQIEFYHNRSDRQTHCGFLIRPDELQQVDVRKVINHSAPPWVRGSERGAQMQMICPTHLPFRFGGTLNNQLQDEVGVKSSDPGGKTDYCNITGLYRFIQRRMEPLKHCNWKDKDIHKGSIYIIIILIITLNIG